MLNKLQFGLVIVYFALSFIHLLGFDVMTVGVPCYE